MNIKKSWFSGLVFFFIIIFFYKTSNQNQLIEIIKNIKIEYLLFTLLLVLIRSFLINYRWFVLVKNFSTISFGDFYKNLNNANTLYFITSASIAVELVRLFKLKNEIGVKKSLFLVSLDKIYSLIFKIFFLVFILNFYIYIFKTNLFMSGAILSLFFVFASLVVIKNTNKILIYLSKLNFLKVNFDIIIQLNQTASKSKLKIYFINFLIQILNIFMYFVIFKSLNINLNLIQLSLFVPMIEFMGQVPFFGLKEISMIYLFQNMNLTQEVVFTAALLNLICESFIIMSIHIFFYLADYSKNIKID